jgi:hypothetical protein
MEPTTYANFYLPYVPCLIFFHFNNFVQCLASVFSILSILVLLFFILRFFSTLYFFYISFVARVSAAASPVPAGRQGRAHSTGRRLPCPCRPPPRLPPSAAAPSALVSHARRMSRPPPSIGLISPLLFLRSPHTTWALPTRRRPRRRPRATVSLPLSQVAGGAHPRRLARVRTAQVGVLAWQPTLQAASCCGPSSPAAEPAFFWGGIAEPAFFGESLSQPQIKPQAASCSCLPLPRLQRARPLRFDCLVSSVLCQWPPTAGAPAAGV